VSDEELKALFAESTKKLKELAELMERLAEEHAKTEVAQRLTQETIRQVTAREAAERARTEEALRQATARQAAEHAKTEEALRQATARQAAEHAKTEEAVRQATARQAAEHAKTEAAQKRTEETLRQVTKQLGGLGNKFGSFTEGLAFDSMRRILERHFGAAVVSSRTRASHRGKSQEFDMVGVRNGAQGEAFLIEVKSELNAQELNKTVEKLGEFFDFMPHLRGMKLYGIVCAVDVRGAAADLVLRQGLYLATAGDENFKLVKPPPGFQPRVFTAA